jgi:hypothetical protein
VSDTVCDMLSSIFVTCLVVAVVLVLGSSPGGSMRPLSCSSPGWRWPRPRVYWLIDSAARQGRRAGMSNVPRRTDRGLSRRRRRCSPSSCPRRWRPRFEPGQETRAARSLPWSPKRSPNSWRGAAVGLGAGERAGGRDRVRVRPPRGHRCVGGLHHPRAPATGPHQPGRSGRKSPT